MPKATKAAVEAHAKYNAKSYDRLYPFTPKGHKAEIEACAKSIDETLNEFINKAIDERMERIQNDFDKLSDARKFYRSEEGRAAIEKLTQK